MPRLFVSFAVVMSGLVGGILAFILTLLAVWLAAVVISWMANDEYRGFVIMIVIAMPASCVTIPLGFIAGSGAIERLIERRKQRRAQDRGFPVITGSDLCR